jgi:hypothetical protein
MWQSIPNLDLRLPASLFFCGLRDQFRIVAFVPLGTFLRLLVLHKVDCLDKRMHHIVQCPAWRQGTAAK